MGVILSNIFLTKQPQQVDPLRIEGRKVSQQYRLRCRQPKGPAKRRDSRCVLNSYGVFNIFRSSTVVREEIAHVESGENLNRFSCSPRKSFRNSPR